MILFFIWKRMFDFFDKPVSVPTFQQFLLPWCFKNPQTVVSTCTWSRVLVAAWRPDLRGARGMLVDIRPDSGVTTTDTCKTLFIRSEIKFVAVLCCYKYNFQRWLFTLAFSTQEERKRRGRKKGFENMLLYKPYTVHSFHQPIPLSLLSPSSHKDITRW